MGESSAQSQSHYKLEVQSCAFGSFHESGRGATGRQSPWCDKWEEGLAEPAASRGACKESDPQPSQQGRPAHHPDPVYPIGPDPDILEEEPKESTSTSRSLEES